LVGDSWASLLARLSNGKTNLTVTGQSWWGETPSSPDFPFDFGQPKAKGRKALDGAGNLRLSIERFLAGLHLQD
jgi:hypothetical protein